MSNENEKKERSPQPSQPKPFIGLAGVGYWGKNLFRDLKSLKVLAGVCEVFRTKELQLSNPGLYITDSWNDFLNNPDITAVMIVFLWRNR
jgi:predicted dehydrogenase